jgi:hypothetical protein
MKFIENGNFTSWFRALIWIIGLSIAGIIAFIGAYAEKANALKIKPFDNSYKKAMESYKNKDKPKA